MIKKKKNLNLDEIVSIEDVGEQDTYDFTIPDTHCFFANGILVHNTLEELADTCLLLHWEHFYRESADENTFKVIIAKQRNGRIGEYLLHYKPEFYKFYDVIPKDDFQKNDIVDKIIDTFEAK